jgi:hypothetical protein
MTDDDVLREHARAAIQAGKLPNRDPSRIWGGNGFWMHCAVCGNVVISDELGYELQFAEDGGGIPAPAEYHVHVRCFTAWDKERRRQHGPTTAEGDPLPAEQGSGTISDRERRPSKREPA